MNKTTKMFIFLLVLMLTALPLPAAPVPDTGITKCYDDSGEIPCPSPGQDYHGQDANYSINPMSYTKLDSSGNALPDSAASWTMVKDNVTGLTWEVKNNKDGAKNYSNPHDADNTYTWYDSNLATNGVYAGTPGDGTDTEDFMKSLNDAQYGGYSDWRMPTIQELSYLVHHSTYPGPTIDTGYFPNTAESWYWSSTTYAGGTDNAWLVGFYSGHGHDGNANKGTKEYVRAVRGGQSGPLDNLVLSVTPANQRVGKNSGTTSFSVTNTGAGTMAWTTEVTSGSDWLSISSGSSGSNSGTINCRFSANTGSSSKTGTIRVTASGAAGSPVDVTVTQAGTGGGDDCVSDWIAQNPPQGTITTQESLDIDCLFDWLETNVPEICYPPTETTTFGFFAYRSYTATGTSLLAWKTSTLKLLYLGPLSENCPLELGDIETLKLLFCP